MLLLLLGMLLIRRVILFSLRVKLIIVLDFLILDERVILCTAAVNFQLVLANLTGLLDYISRHLIAVCRLLAHGHVCRRSYRLLTQPVRKGRHQAQTRRNKIHRLEVRRQRHIVR